MSKHITFCQMTLNNLSNTKESIKRVQPYVDRIVMVDGGSTDETIPTLRAWKGIDLYIHPWTDNFSQQRNNCLSHCRDTDWILFMDPDEWLSDEAGKNLKDIVSAQRIHDLIRFKCRDLDMMGNIVCRDARTTFYKPLVFKYYQNNTYTGNLHETIRVDGRGAHETRVDFEYYHVKQELQKIVSGSRNLFIGGTGVEVVDRGEMWVNVWRPFRKIIKDLEGIETWNDFHRYLLCGHIDQRIKDVIIKNRNESGYEGAPEWMDLYKVYFELYHPEEEPVELRRIK